MSRETVPALCRLVPFILGQTQKEDKDRLSWERQMNRRQKSVSSADSSSVVFFSSPACLTRDTISQGRQKERREKREEGGKERQRGGSLSLQQVINISKRVPRPLSARQPWRTPQGYRRFSLKRRLAAWRPDDVMNKNKRNNMSQVFVM